jgi:hypothetical protein
MEEFELFAVVVILMAIIWVVHRIWEKKRSTTLQEFSNKLNLEFTKEGSHETITDYQEFPLLNRGHDKKLINKLSNPHDRNEPIIFGYKYTLSSGSNSNTFSQTVAWCPNRKSLPSFMIKPETMLSKISNLLRLDAIKIKDNSVFTRRYELKGDYIKFKDRPGFSKHYQLMGDDSSSEISMLFSSFITDYFEKHQGISIESCPSGMLVYFDNRRIKSEEISVFFNQVKNINSLFCGNVIPDDNDITIKNRSGIYLILIAIVLAIIPVGFIIWMELNS